MNIPVESDFIQLRETGEWINSQMKKIAYLHNTRLRITVTYELTSDVWIARASFGIFGEEDSSFFESDGNTLSQALTDLKKDLSKDRLARVVRDLKDAAGLFAESYNPYNQ